MPAQTQYKLAKESSISDHSTIAKWRDVHDYFSYPSETVPRLQRSLGVHILGLLTTEEGVQQLSQEPVVIANFNARKLEQLVDDKVVQDMLEACPGTYRIDEGIFCRFNMAFTSALGHHALRVVRSEVPDVVPDRDPRIIYAMAGRFAKPLPIRQQS